MNKYLLGLINNMLLAPVIESPGGGSGATPAPSPQSENIYGGDAPAAGAEGAVGEGGEKPDFTNGEGKGDPLPNEGEQKFIDLTKKAEGEQPAGEGEQPAGEQPAAPAPGLLKLDPETIAELRKGLTAPQGEQRQEQAAPRLTPQQLKEMLNPVEVSGEMLKSLGFENATPEQIAGFQNFTNAIVKNAVSIARVMIDQKAKQFEGALSPITENMQKAQVEQTRGEFFGAHKDLAKYEKIVKLAAAEIQPVGADGKEKTKEQIFKEVADKTRATLKEYGITLTPANLGAEGGKPAGGVPPPNKLSPSGRSGGDTNGQRGRPNDADADIYKR